MKPAIYMISGLFVRLKTDKATFETASFFGSNCFEKQIRDGFPDIHFPILPAQSLHEKGDFTLLHVPAASFMPF